MLLETTAPSRRSRARCLQVPKYDRAVQALLGAHPDLVPEYRALRAAALNQAEATIVTEWSTPLEELGWANQDGEWDVAPIVASESPVGSPQAAVPLPAPHPPAAEPPEPLMYFMVHESPVVYPVDDSPEPQPQQPEPQPQQPEPQQPEPQPRYLNPGPGIGYPTHDVVIVVAAAQRICDIINPFLNP